MCTIGCLYAAGCCVVGHVLCRVYARERACVPTSLWLKTAAAAAALLLIEVK